MGIFNLVDYVELVNIDDNYGNSSGNMWNNIGYFELDDGMSVWRIVIEEWGIEDWNEDFFEIKIFIVFNVFLVFLFVENVIIIVGQRIDFVVLLGKILFIMENDLFNLDLFQVFFLVQFLVFSNLKQIVILQFVLGNIFFYYSMVSMLGKGFGDVGEVKGGSTIGFQFLE